ncbi:tetratricopeptide repeat protein [Nannocystis sp.]|uniref:tetratricopeptide repeat protein n=1 Tax=Nannocystis sp. TaxID=1962667 RepID=UPI0025F392CF|nr:tetratricopeptide repeat protein [Nannocystis sp.]MBK7826803.1 hypothetical protein [Nannocystis sp.]
MSAPVSGSGVAPPSAATPGAATLWTPGIRDAAHPGRFVREFARRKALLRAPGPEAVLALLGAMVELQGEIPGLEMAAFLDGARKHREPLVASHAGYLRAQLEEARGDQARATAMYRAEGFVLDWQIVGPFENTGRAGHAAVYAPETDPFSAGQSFVGKLPGEPLVWRRFVHEQAPRGAFINLADLLDPPEQAVGYATVWVKVDRPGRAALHLGTSGAYKVWHDGVLVGSDDTYRTPTPLQASHALELRAGWNRILIKLATDDGMWGFYARLSAPDGRPLAGLVSTLEPQSTPVSPGAKDRSVSTGPKGQVAKASPGAGGVASSPVGVGRPGAGGVASSPVGVGRPGVRSLRAALEAKGQGPRARPADRLALVEFYRWTLPFAREDRSAVDRAREADSALGTARSAYLLATLDPDQNNSRVALQRAVERARAEGSGSREGGAPLLATLLVELSLRDRYLGLESRARALLDEAFRTAPDDVIVELALAERLSEDGFPLAALAWVGDMQRRYPDSAILARQQAERRMNLGRTEEALQILGTLQGAQPTDLGVAAEMQDGLLRLGRADEAVAIARERVRLVPGLPESHRALARFEEARGDLAAARAAMQRAADLAPA